MKWLKSCADKKAKIYTDWYGGNRLLSQGMIRSHCAKSFVEDKESIKVGYIGVIDSKLMDKNYRWRNIMDEYQSIFMGEDRIYANGSSEVWK